MHNNDFRVASHPTCTQRAVLQRSLALVPLLAALLLTACGGGGGGGSGGGNGSATVTPPTAPDPLVPVPDNTFGVDCAGTHCAALDVSTYAGSGVGIWRYSNTSMAPAVVPVALTGTGGRSVTLVMTNLDNASTINGNIVAPGFSGNRHVDPVANDGGESEPRINQIPARIRHFQPPVLEPEPEPEVTVAARSLAPSATMHGASVGQGRLWYDHEENQRYATLEQQLTASDGRVINFWVENGEYIVSRVTPALLNALSQAFAGGNNPVYGLVTGLADQPWGSHNYGSALIAPSQPLDIVLLNLDNNGRPWELVGFFWGLNNFRNGANGISTSNESLSLYLDTETLYLGNGGLQFEISTLAHELTHMINFYQRVIKRSSPSSDYSYDTWLEEMSALMMEDVVGSRITPNYHVIRDDRFPAWLNAGDFNCDLTQFESNTSSACFGYNLAGSFGAWLLRHYGIDFYKALLAGTSSTDSIALLDNTIRARGGPGFKDAVRRWGTLLALLPAASPPWFGLPERSEQGFTLPAINGSAYVNVRRLPTVAPNPLQANGHYPQLRSNVANTYTETVTVPAYTTLTVIVK